MAAAQDPAILDTCMWCRGTGYGTSLDRDGNPTETCFWCDGQGDVDADTVARVQDNLDDLRSMSRSELAR